MTNPFVSASVKMFHVTCQPIICSRKNAWALQINKCWLNDPLNSNTYLQTFHMMLQRTRECRKIRKERMQNLFADYQGLLETQGFNVSRAMTLSTFWNSKQKLKAWKIMVWEQNRNYLQIITKSFSNRLIERFFWSMVPKSHLTSLSSSYTALVAKRALNWPTQMNKYDNSPKCVGDLSTRELSSCENGGNSEPF